MPALIPAESASGLSLAVPTVSLPPLPASLTLPRPAAIWSEPSLVASTVALKRSASEGAEASETTLLSVTLCGLAALDLANSTLGLATVGVSDPSPETRSLPLPTVIASLPGPPATTALAEVLGSVERFVRSRVVTVSLPAPESTKESPSPVRITSSPAPVKTTVFLVNGLGLAPLSVPEPPTNVTVSLPA